jgi:hypothetical protein
MPSMQGWGGRSGKDPSDWLENRVDGWLFNVDWWERLFRAANIKLWLAVSECEFHTAAQRAALDRVNGLLLYRQRSEYLGYRDSMAYLPGHIVFVWNQGTVDYLKMCRNQNDRAIVIGHSFGAHESSSFPAADRLRKELEHEGARFVVCLFDGFFLNNNNMTSEEMRALYNHLFGWLRDHSDVGLIIKPKKFWSYTKKHVDADVLGEAMATERLRFVEEPNILPLALARAADLTIGVAISSAALEANIAGQRAIHHHPGYSDSHILEREAMGRLVFTDLEAVAGAIDRVYAGQGGDIGLLGDLLPQVDEFHDGQGPDRMRQAIGYLLDADLGDKEKAYRGLDELGKLWRSNRAESLSIPKGLGSTTTETKRNDVIGLG